MSRRSQKGKINPQDNDVFVGLDVDKRNMSVRIEDGQQHVTKRMDHDWQSLSHYLDDHYGGTVGSGSSLPMKRDLRALACMMDCSGKETLSGGGSGDDPPGTRVTGQDQPAGREEDLSESAGWAIERDSRSQRSLSGLAPCCCAED